MLLSLSFILLLGMFLGYLCQKIKLPSLVGMILTGIILGPNLLNLIDPSILEISAPIRKIALIIILTRAGLTLNLNDLKKIGRPAILMCFVPASFEILGVIILGPMFLGLSVLESALLGSVLGAVSPAVVVPRMLKIIEEGYGKEKSIPQLILAGASVDDVFVIVMFTTFLGLNKGEKINILNFINIPFSIVIGIFVGLLVGYLLSLFFKKFHMRDTAKVLIILSISFILVCIEDAINAPINFSSLIAIMFMGIGLNKYRPVVAKRLNQKYNKLWVGSEIFLFVLVGALVEIKYIPLIGISSILLVICALVFRMGGVFLSVFKTKLSNKEKLFAMISYTPKATVQAAIGGIPLAAGLSCGQSILTIAVIAILLTAPLGGFFIDLTYKKLLEK